HWTAEDRPPSRSRRAGRTDGAAHRPAHVETRRTRGPPTLARVPCGAERSVFGTGLHDVVCDSRRWDPCASRRRPSGARPATPEGAPALPAGAPRPTAPAPHPPAARLAAGR